MITSDQRAENINDHVPMTNVTPFGMCMSPSNPAFVSATAIAFRTRRRRRPALWQRGRLGFLGILDGMPALD